MNEDLERDIQGLELEVHCLYARRDPLRRAPNSNNRVLRMRRDVKQLAGLDRQRGTRIDVHLPAGSLLAATILGEYGSAACVARLRSAGVWPRLIARGARRSRIRRSRSRGHVVTPHDAARLA